MTPNILKLSNYDQDNLGVSGDFFRRPTGPYVVLKR